MRKQPGLVVFCFVSERVRVLGGLKLYRLHRPYRAIAVYNIYIEIQETSSYTVPEQMERTQQRKKLSSDVAWVFLG